MRASTRSDFHSSVAEALETGNGLAAGKIGYSEHAILRLPALIDTASDPVQRRALTSALTIQACRHAGVFPDDEAFLREFGIRLLQVYQRMDYLAVPEGLPAPLCLDDSETPRRLSFEGLEPNRTRPYDPDDCYLPHFRDARILIVSSLADVLAERAKRKVFESVWSRIGAPWPEPKSVQALCFPFIYDTAVQSSGESVWGIYDEVCQVMATSDFDVALIAAGALGSPIALAAKDLGSIGISLGGHLQVLFGMHGKRWLDDAEWSARYINDAWIAPPQDRKPHTSRGLADDGAYW